MKSLESSFYMRDTVTVARELLGKHVVRIIDGQLLAGIIIETEAYGHANDPASHAYKISGRSISMFGPVGYAYVYFIYGNHFCFNVVARDQNAAAGAVLIRAVKPITGIELMQQYRAVDLKNLTNGPGKLTQALQITKQHDGQKLGEETGLYIAESLEIVVESQIIATPRIGISKAQDKLWRFFIEKE